MLELPTFHDGGQISMSDVLHADFSEFAELGLDVISFLNEVRDGLNDERLGYDEYREWRGEVLHSYLVEHVTPEGKARKDGYQHTKEYCLAYKILCFLECLSVTTKHFDLREFDQEILGMEIEKIRSPGSMLGHCKRPLPFDTHDIAIVPKGCQVWSTHSSK